MSEVRNALIKHYLQTVEKFDYFVVGISAATFAYFAKPFTFNTSFTFNTESMMLLAITSLMFSVVFGLAKIFISNIKHEKNYKLVECEDTAKEHFSKSELEGIDPGKKSWHLTEAQKFSNVQNMFADLIGKISTGIKVCQYLRDAFLLLGYLLVITSKFLA
ncbi:MAG: hypothetical protein KJ556_16555 [Gammaproteobacteria bacterium]|nr:hypothetical protein [Gammaproteobacteria bacterium]MBU2057838.1 hypothetical protein [Gammaproteobacteria bacterium]MBU2176727.1 hypothetical protein [Gammaproteobacteria bacterium]MBU2247860.1 hypothetical protein [Gammaproteobacteria bacterium]MBU2346033.1 hypothetical protein [Gammaproteobacteria bacterium]